MSDADQVDWFGALNLSVTAPTLALIALMLGTLLPVITQLLFGTTFANPVWGSIYALGFWLWETLFGYPGFGNLGFLYAVVGAVLWPLSVTVGLAVTLARALGRACRLDVAREG